MDELTDQNRKRWDELTPHHISSTTYNLEGFRQGRNTLLPLEREELGDVRGRSLAHLQCHFGLDSLSLARMGASVTGIDFSPVAIEAATELACELQLDARFVVSDVYNAHQALKGERFDIVFTSWGVLSWLPDVAAWARTIAALLKPGGRFYIAEIHPVAWLFESNGSSPNSEGQLQTYPYFGEGRPLSLDLEGSYAAPDARLTNRTEHTWLYETGQVINSIIDAGLTLQYFREHQACCKLDLPGMTQGKDKMWRLPQSRLNLPLSFAISAIKPKA